MTDPRSPDPRPQTESELVEFVRSIDVRAPDSLHRQVESLLAERSPLARRRRIRGFARAGAPRSFGFVPRLAAQDSNALVAQDGVSILLVARRSMFAPFLTRYGLQADVAYAVSASDSHDRASAWFTSDDDARQGCPFAVDGVTFYHRHYNRIPGTVAIHCNSKSLTALHEFGHNLGLAYLAAEHAGPGTALEIPILGQRRAATVIADSPYDPGNRRPRM